MAEPGKRRENGSGLDAATAGALAVGTAAIGTGAAELHRRANNARILGGRALPADGAPNSAAFGDFVRSKIQSDDALRAVHRITGYEGRIFNKYVRTGEVAEIKGNKYVPSSDPRAKASLDWAVRGVDQALSEPVPEGTKLYRGVGLKNALKVGQVLRDAAPLSTSTSLDIATEFERFAATQGKSALLVIDGKGAKGLSAESFSQFTREKEIMLARNTPLRVTHVAEGYKRHLFAKKQTIAFAEVAPGAAPSPVTKEISQAMGAVKGGGLATTLTKTAALTTPVAAASVAALAYKAARDAGKSEARATVEAAGAGMATAAMPAAVGAAAAKLGKVHSVGAKVLGVASRALLPASVIGHAGAYAYAAIQRGEGLADVAKAAGWGAVNGVIPVDLAMEAYQATAGRSSAPSADPSRRSSASGQLDAGNEASFKRADADFRQRWASANGTDKQPGEKGKGETRKGWANPSVQRSAQEARGVQNFTDWAEKVPR